MPSFSIIEVPASCTLLPDPEQVSICTFQYKQCQLEEENTSTFGIERILHILDKQKRSLCASSGPGKGSDKPLCGSKL